MTRLCIILNLDTTIGIDALFIRTYGFIRLPPPSLRPPPRLYPSPPPLFLPAITKPERLPSQCRQRALDRASPCPPDYNKSRLLPCPAIYPQTRYVRRCFRLWFPELLKAFRLI